MSRRERGGGGYLTADLAPLADWVYALDAEGEGTLPPERASIVVTDATGAARGRMIVFAVGVRRRDGRLELGRLEGLLWLEEGLPEGRAPRLASTGSRPPRPAQGSLPGYLRAPPDVLRATFLTFRASQCEVAPAGGGVRVSMKEDFSMPPGYPGEFEQMVLLTIMRLGEGAYGQAVRDEMASVTGRSPSSGSLYTTLDRLERKGLIASREGEASGERGGRPRRYARVTPAGAEALRHARQALLALWDGLESNLDRA